VPPSPYCAGLLLDDSCRYEVLAAEPGSPSLGRLLLNKMMLRDHYLDGYLAALAKAAAGMGAA
jgi:hypothetical protein